MPSGSVLITGASSGIGRVTARAFNDADWTVYATARDRDDLGGLAADGCETLALDVEEPSACADAVDQVVADHGTIDCLVNNAGYAQWGPLEDVPPERLDQQFAVNCVGPHRLSRLVLPHMREAEAGTIVNVSSVLGSLAVPGYGAYSASKQALEALSDTLRPEVAPFGIDVVIVAPGPVETEFRSRAMAELERLEQTPAYDVIYRYFEDREATDDIGASTPDAVADAVLSAATASDPPPRIPVGQVAGIGELASHVPRGLRDVVYGLARRVLS